MTSARLDDDGYLRLVGRASDAAATTSTRARSGRDPSEHPDVVDAAVVGVPDDTWGERVVAFVVREGASYADDALAAGSAPTSARGSRRTSAPNGGPRAPTCPRNAMGKVLRDQPRTT